jgi:hypothetical protein
MVSQIRVCGADQSPSTSQLGAAPGNQECIQSHFAVAPGNQCIQSLDVPPRLTSVQRGEVVLRVEEVAGYGGTFEDAVNAWMIREPEMMPFPGWARWRKAKAFLPIPKRGADRLLAYLEELKIWDRVMRFYHEEWRWFMDTWAITETENVEAYLEAIKEDEKVLEQPAPRETAEFEGNSVVAAVPVGIALVEDSYEQYVRRMRKLYAALDMSFIRVDEVKYQTEFWDSEIAAQISSFGKDDRVAWLKKLFVKIATAPDDLLRKEEKESCADVIVKQIMEQGQYQERGAIWAQRTEGRDRISCHSACFISRREIEESTP